VARHLLRLEPAFALSSYMRRRQPFCDPTLRERFLAHLRLAGFPD
jgi:hypothetical protein